MCLVPAVQCTGDGDDVVCCGVMCSRVVVCDFILYADAFACACKRRIDCRHVRDVFVVGTALPALRHHCVVCFLE